MSVGAGYNEPCPFCNEPAPNHAANCVRTAAMLRDLMEEIERLSAELARWEAPENYGAFAELLGLDPAGPGHGNKAIAVAAAIALLKNDRDAWQVRHDRERAAHAANLKGWQKCEADRDRLAHTGLVQASEILELKAENTDLLAANSLKLAEIAALREEVNRLRGLTGPTGDLRPDAH